MARKEKPVKIIRYKTNRRGNRVKNDRIYKILALIGAAAAIVAVGFLRTKFVLNRVENNKNKPNSAPAGAVESTVWDTSSETPVSEIVRSSSDGGDPSQAVVAKARVYYYSAASKLTGEAGIDAEIGKAKALGANCLVFDAKDSNGNILYNSENQYGRQLKADAVIDIELLVKKCSENGIAPAARIYTFEDSLISNIERSTAVMYVGTDTRWLDSSAALGGKPWANPASEIMQTYIKDLTDELLSKGIKEFIFAGFCTPTGYSLDKRDFGASEDRVLAAMKSLIKTLKAKISAKGGYSAWQIEYSAVDSNGRYAQYLVHPYRLGAENIIVTAESGTDVSQAAEYLNRTKPEEIISLTLWVNGADNTAAKEYLDNYFVN